MSHGLTEKDSAAYFGKSAWHGLGTVLPADSDARYNRHLAMAASGLNWEVGLSPLQIPAAGSYTVGESDNARTFDVDEVMAGKMIPDAYTVYRKDTGDPLGVVGSQYRCLQNREQFEFFDPFLESREAMFETCGSLFGGRTIWILARIGDDITIQQDSFKPDLIRQNILLTTSHDGSKSTQFGFTPYRVECANLLRMATNSKASKLLKVKHTRGQKPALEAIRDAMNLARAEFTATAEQYRKMVRCPINRQSLVDYVRLVFEQPTREQIEESRKTGKELKISTRMSNIIDTVLDLSINADGAAMAGNTVWGAYNAVTNYITHKRGRSQESRLAAQWFGDGAKINQRAMDLAVQMAG